MERSRLCAAARWSRPSGLSFSTMPPKFSTVEQAFRPAGKLQMKAALAAEVTSWTYLPRNRPQLVLSSANPAFELDRPSAAKAALLGLRAAGLKACSTQRYNHKGRQASASADSGWCVEKGSGSRFLRERRSRRCRYTLQVWIADRISRGTPAVASIERPREA